MGSGGREVTGLGREVRRGGGVEGGAVMQPTTAPLVVPGSAPSHQTTVTVVSSSRSGNVITLSVKVQSTVAVSLFNTSPILVDITGKGFSATKESVDAASIVALDLAQNGAADFTLDFPVAGGFAPTTLILNNGADSP